MCRQISDQINMGTERNWIGIFCKKYKLKNGILWSHNGKRERKLIVFEKHRDYIIGLFCIDGNLNVVEHVQVLQK